MIAFRRVIRAVDLHSRALVHSHGLTGPQAMALKEVTSAGAITAGELARRISLSQATVTDIVKRLESRGLLRRTRDQVDKRRVLISVTARGEAVHASAPPLLQEKFLDRLHSLQDWEQNLLLASLQRIAELMDAEDLDAAPMLATGEVSASPEIVDSSVTNETLDEA